MGGFQTTTFSFVNGSNAPLTFEAIMVYNSNNEWQQIVPGTPSEPGNLGIMRPTISNPSMPNGGDTCTVTLDMNAEEINSSPYSSGGSSLLFSINGSNIHIDIHSNGQMESKGVFGVTPGAVNWSPNFGGVGEMNNFMCTGD